MTATDADHERNLLAAIRRATLDGDDDLAERAALADLWMESGGDVECKACGGSGEGKRDFDGYPRDCPACHGSGRVSDGRRERGEFVAVQLELAGLEEQIREMQSQFPSPHRKPLILPDVTYSSPRYESACDRRDALRARERELFNANLCRWVAGEVITNGAYRLPGDNDPLPADAVRLEFRRGFISSVTLDCGTLCGGGECEGCEGTGRVYRSEMGEYRRLRCGFCNGTGRTPGIAAELGRACPTLEAVRVTGRTPSRSGRVWNWYDQDLLDGAFPGEGPHEYGLPHELFVMLPDECIVKTADGRNSGCSTHPSPAAAQNALNAAALRLIFPERN